VQAGRDIDSEDGILDEFMPEAGGQNGKVGQELALADISKRVLAKLTNERGLTNN